MLNVIKTFSDLDPSLQAVAFLTLLGFIAIAAFQGRRFIQKRRSRRRAAQAWIHY